MTHSVWDALNLDIGCETAPMSALSVPRSPPELAAFWMPMAMWMVNCIPAVSEHGTLEKKECDLPVFDIHPNFDMVHAEPIIFESIAVSKNEHVHVESVVHESNAVFAYDMVPQHDMIPQHDMVFEDEQFFQNVSLIQSIEFPKDFKVFPNDPIESNALVINLNPMPTYKNPQILLQSVLNVEGKPIQVAKEKLLVLDGMGFNKRTSSL